MCVIWKTFNHALAHTNAMNFGIHGQTRTIYNFLFSELSIGTVVSSADSALSHTYGKRERQSKTRIPNEKLFGKYLSVELVRN